MLSPDEDDHWMGLALDQAHLALEEGEVPVGCVVVLGARVIGRGWNRVETSQDPTAHAEILAISAACSTLGYSRLEGTRVYVTVEPCVMCAGALLLARVDEVIYGATEPKFGAIESRTRMLEVAGLNHRYRARGGVRSAESAGMLREFFRTVRLNEGAPGRHRSEE